MAVIGGARSPDAALLRRMSHLVSHRGPDGERLFQSGPVALAFRRLSLVGPDHGDQPLFSEDLNSVLIANGEIYNHRELATGPLRDVRLRTDSDCEVLVHLYARKDLAFLDDVNGMFAIVLFDRRRNRLLLARDRFSIKPLYYSRIGDTVVFASEIKALFAHPNCPRELDWNAALADQCLNVGPYVTHDPVTSWFRGINVVPAGAVITINLTSGHTEQRTYWNLPSLDGTSDATDEEFVTTYRQLLAESVANCSTADAELGLFLSGGVDSAAVAAFAARHGNRIDTFTVLSGSTLANGDAEFAHRTAKALGLPNHQVLFASDQVPTPDQWKQLLWLLETPLCGPEQYYKYELYRYAKQVRPELRGMLLGQASDEYNGGYSTIFAVGQDWASFEASLLQLARATVLHDRPALLPWWDHAGKPLLADGLLREHASGLLDDPYASFVAWKHRDVQQYNCWHEDRTAAGNGVEARVPFLDHRIVEWVAGIPAKRRSELLWNKKILRRAVQGLLPEDVAWREKVAFFYGAGESITHRVMVRMLAAEDDLLVETALAAPGAQGLLNPDGLRGMLRYLEQDPEPSGVDFLLRVVNLGLLDQLTRESPIAPVDAARPEIKQAVSITDWEADSPTVARQLRRVDAPAPDEVLTLADGVLLLAAPDDPGVLYAAVNGQLEYVVNHPEWSAFLRHIDGCRTVAEILADSGVTATDIHQELRDALDVGLLEATDKETANNGSLR